MSAIRKGASVRLSKLFKNGNGTSFAKDSEGVVERLHNRHLVVVRLKGVDHPLYVPREDLRVVGSF